LTAGSTNVTGCDILDRNGGDNDGEGILIAWN